MILQCLNCQAQFKIKPFALTRGRGKYCQRKCYLEYRKKYYVVSDKTRKKLSIAGTGRIVSQETRDKVSRKFKGRIMDADWIKKISIALTGRKNPSCSGNKHPCWRGGITSDVMRIRNSPEYNQWRKKVYERDNFTCQFCRQKGGRLNADHIRPFSLFPELRLDINNGRTLCYDCHRRTESYGKLKKSFQLDLL